MKLIVSCFTSFLLLFNICFAAGAVLPNANNLFEGSNDRFIEVIDSSDAGQGLNAILLLLYKVGYGVAIIVTMILAIKLIITSPSKKADVKAGVAPYLIGLLLLIVGVPIAIKIIELFTLVF